MLLGILRLYQMTKCCKNDFENHKKILKLEENKPNTIIISDGIIEEIRKTYLKTKYHWQTDKYFGNLKWVVHSNHPPSFKSFLWYYMKNFYLKVYPKYNSYFKSY